MNEWYNLHPNLLLDRCIGGDISYIAGLPLSEKLKLRYLSKNDSYRN